MNLNELEAKLSGVLNQIPLDSGQKKNLLTSVLGIILEVELENKLQILYEYEKHSLDLIKEYKEEIKFANTVQEDLRRERSQFFSQGLKEVCDTLKTASIDDSVASKWIQELVESYTKSLNLSTDLANHNVIDILGQLKEDAKKELREVNSVNHENTEPEKQNE